MFQAPLLRLAAAASAVVVVFAGVACSSGGDPEAGPTTASPSPTPSRIEAEPVRGEPQVQLFAVSNEQAVWGRDQAGVDPAAVDPIAGRITNWLNAHLSDLQVGGPGKLDEVAAAGLLEGTSPDAQTSVTTALASPDRLVESVSYQLVVAHTDSPQWVRATVEVTPRDGHPRTAHFVFEVAEDAVALVAAGPGAGEGES